jgi:hypothetical protein
MPLSRNSYENLGAAMAQEVADYISNDDSWREYLLGIVPEAVKHHLGGINEDVLFDLTQEIAQRIVIVGLED